MKIVIYGAGAVGCYLGAALIHGGADVTLLGRAKNGVAIAKASGIRLTDYLGHDYMIMGSDYALDDAALADADIIFVTLKCGLLKRAARILNKHVKPDALIVCLQNGIGTDDIVKQTCINNQVITGIVAFNVVQNEHHFHRTTEGEFILPELPELKLLAELHQNPFFDYQLVGDIEPYRWGRLLLNLNNAINALADMPLKQQLAQKSYRMILAASMEELLNCCRKSDIELAQLTFVKPDKLPKILRLPNWLFTKVATQMLAIDPCLRSSMWEDLQTKQETEIDYLNGAVVTLAKKLGCSSPVNNQLVSLIKQKQAGTLMLTEQELLQNLLKH